MLFFLRNFLKHKFYVLNVKRYYFLYNFLKHNFLNVIIFYNLKIYIKLYNFKT